MPNNDGSPRKRDERGLLLEQKLVLQELEQHSDWKRACDAADVTHDKFRRWLRIDEPFKTAFNLQNAQQTDTVRKQIELSAQKAGEVYDEALTANKDLTLEVTCPNCKHEMKITAEVPDWSTRLKAGEVVLKVGKILKDVKEVSGKITVEQLDLPLRLALAAHEAGRPIPPGFYNRLVADGFIKQPQLPAGDVQEGEWHEVDTTDEQLDSGDRVAGGADMDSSNG
jgi:hypothetical protein